MGEKWEKWEKTIYTSSSTKNTRGLYKATPRPHEATRGFTIHRGCLVVIVGSVNPRGQTYLDRPMHRGGSTAHRGLRGFTIDRGLIGAFYFDIQQHRGCRETP